MMNEAPALDPSTQSNAESSSSSSLPRSFVSRPEIGILIAALVMGALLRDLRPDWAVLRPFEATDIEQNDAELISKLYQPVHVFDVSGQVAQVPYLPGRGFLEGDQAFTVYHRLELPPEGGTALRLEMH